MKHLSSLILLFLIVLSSSAQKWEYNSSAFGDMPTGLNGHQQTAAMVMDIDKDGVDEWIIASRVGTPSLVYYKYDRAIGWRVFNIEKIGMTIEAGGAHYDIDNDGDEDIVFGGDWQSNEVWWWENPYPYFNPNVPWKRYVIKNDGQKQHHDQVFGDFLGIGRAQLAFWNQQMKTLYLAQIPQKAKEGPWPYTPIFSGEAGESKSWYAEGCDAADVDGDGKVDLIAGNYWFKVEGNKFNAIRFGDEGGRVKAAKFKVGKRMQLLVSPGDGTGNLMLYTCTGNAEDSKNWKGVDLIGRELVHAHTLEVADINQDGALDIFVAEMAQWSDKVDSKADQPNSEAFILYGDGKGGFTKTLFQKGFDFHEGKLADIDGDGDIDILSKPYTWKAPRVDIWHQNGTGEAKPKINKSIKDRIGLEMYSLRDYTKTDLPGTLAYVKSLGINEVEITDVNKFTALEYKTALDKAGLTVRSKLISFEDIRDNIDKVIADCKILGIRYIGIGWIPHRQNQFSIEDAKKAVAVFNEGGEKLAQEGIGLFYHCHGYEFKTTEDGSTLFDYIVQHTNPTNVSYECDVYWAFHGGQDPTLLLRKYPGRFVAIHLKDMVFGQATGELSGGTPLTSDVEIGTGQLDFKSILRAALDTGVKFMYLEDENAEVKAHLPNSIKYLNAIK
jgi:sugar phosphate isomerase/epimerase